jgi:L-amino acid N-acyltransferase YncA
MIGRMDASGAVRRARREDCEAIARIYNEGIAERRSTFETEPRSEGDIEEWLASPRYPVLVAERNGVIAGWALSRMTRGGQDRSREPFATPAPSDVS